MGDVLVFSFNSFLVVDNWWWWVGGQWGWGAGGGVTYFLLVAPMKVVDGGGGGGIVMVAVARVWVFLIYFRKLNNKNLKIEFDLNRCTYGKYLLVEHGVEEER